MTILGDEMKKTRSPDYYGAQRIKELETVNRALVEALEKALDMACGIDAVGMTDIRDCLRTALEFAKEKP